MSPREFLMGRLSEASTRMWRQACVRGGAWGGALLSVLAACHELVQRMIPVPAVVAAIRPLLLLAAIGVVVGAGVRMVRRPTLARAAAATDARAGLRDELLSAHWFTLSAETGGIVDLHVARAASGARSLDLRRLFPLRLPRNAVVVTAVSCLIAGLALGLPVHTAKPGAAEGTPVEGHAHRVGDVSRDMPATSPEVVGQEVDAGDGRTALWKQVETLARDLVGRPAGQSLAEAIAARDARAAAQALRAARDAAAATTTGGAPVEQSGEQMNDAMAKDILARLSALIQQEEASPPAPRGPASSESDRSTAQLDRELRQEDEDAQRGARRDQTPGEDAVNTSLRALSRSSTGGRDAVHGEADTTQGAGRASVGGGAMGRRINTSTAGSGEGDQPTGEAARTPEDDVVLGRKTERLAVQLKAVKVQQRDGDEKDPEDDQAGTEESFYAATRAQAARVSLSSVEATLRSSAETASSAERSPLEYREAVKRYTLARHQRERDPNRAAAEGR